MHFDTLNFTLLCLAVLFLGIALYRYRTFKAPSVPRNPIGFQP